MPETKTKSKSETAPKPARAISTKPSWLRWPQVRWAGSALTERPDDVAALWRARAVRYTLIYVALVAALLGMRYATKDTYPQLRELRDEISTLQTQRDTLDLQVQQLTTGPRILDWARTHDMVPYAQAAKQSAVFKPLPAPEVPAPQPLKVQTQWR